MDASVTRWMADHGLLLLRLSLGIVFLWFGALKFFTDLSPAADLASRTIRLLTVDALSHRTALIVLAAWECLIGLGLLLNVLPRITLLLLWMQMFGALLPLFLFPDVSFRQAPHVPTLEGQYMIKNIVLISAAIVIGATVRGGRLTAGSSETDRS